MNCTNHPDKEATGACVYCGKLFCEECLVEVSGKNYCRDCVTKAFEEQKEKSATPSININNNNNVTAAASATAIGGIGVGGYSSTKSKMLTLLLCIFGGYIGLHRFYAGKIGSGILYLFTFGIFGIGWILDILKVLSGTFTDGSGLPINK